MNAQVNIDTRVTRDLATTAAAVQAVVAEHGIIRVALALAALAARRRGSARLWEGDLPDRLRRDIGLDPLPPSRNWWEL